MAEPFRKESLKTELATAREQLSAHSLGLRRSLSVKERFKRSFRQHPSAWFGGAAVLGLALSRIPAREGRPKKEMKAAARAAAAAAAKESAGSAASPAGGAGKAAFAATALKLAIDLAKPSLVRWLKERAKEFAQGQARAAARGEGGMH